MKEETGKVMRVNGRDDKLDNSNSERKPSRMPRDSILFEKIVPAALVILGLVTVGLIGFAFAGLLGLVSF